MSGTWVPECPVARKTDLKGPIGQVKRHLGYNFTIKDCQSSRQSEDSILEFYRWGN
jgi:hypothetical protein